MAVDVTDLVFYHSAARGNFSESAEPTIEGAVGTDSINRSVADGDQVPDVVDGNRLGILTLDSNASLMTSDEQNFNAQGNWDTSDANVSIAGGKLVFNVVASGDGAVFLNLVKVGVSYRVVMDQVNAEAGGIKAVLGGTSGTTRTTVALHSEIIKCGSSNNTLEIQATAANTETDLGFITLLPLDSRFDMIMDKRIDIDTLIVDNEAAHKAFGSDRRNAYALHHHTSDAFGSATQLTPTGGYGRVLGQEFGYLDLDGVDDIVTVAEDADLRFGTGDFSIEIIYKHSCNLKFRATSEKRKFI